MRLVLAMIACLVATAATADEARAPDAVMGRWFSDFFPCGSADALKGGVVFEPRSVSSMVGAYRCTFDKMKFEDAPGAPPDAVGEWRYEKTCVSNGGSEHLYGSMRMTQENSGQKLEVNDADDAGGGLYGAPPRNPTIMLLHRCP